MKLSFNCGLQKRPLQYAAAFTSLLATICSGIHFGWTSPYLPILLGDDSPIQMTNEESSWVAVIYLVGGPLGAIFTGLILDNVGRKTVLLSSCVPFLISWILIGFAKTLPALLIARFLAGFSDGLIFGVTPIYFGEICDPEIRGFLGCSITANFLIGILLVNIAGEYLSIQHSSVLFSILPIIFFITFVWMPESPNFFLLKQNKEKARNSMIALKGSLEADHNLELVAEAIGEENLRLVRFVTLFNKTNRKSLLVVMGLRMSQQFSGIIAFNFYAQTIFKETGGSISPLISVVIFYCIQLMCSLLSSLFVDKVGRKPLLLISTMGSGVCLLVEGCFFLARDVIKLDTDSIKWLPTTVLIVFIMSFSIGLQTVPLFLGAEIFPTNVKAYSAAISDVYYFAFAAIASKYFQFTMDEYGMHVPFLTFALCCAAGLIIIAYFVPETKNKTLEQIQLELKK